ncbi:MAG TPA: hypothetical protein DIT64_21785 [Verrucomicrobiales bacterium]|nr:hypothetical protein [Verrucomicrobiales bacterium]
MTRFPRPGCWFRFTQADWNFIRQTLAPDERARRGLDELMQDPESLPLILDNDLLFDAAVVSRERAAPLSPELFFFLVARHALKECGIRELAVADYMAVVCADYGCAPAKGPGQIERGVDSLYSVDYLEAIENAGRHHRFFLHVQCANQFLVLTCLYPDFLHRRAARRGAPDVDYYEQVVVSHLDSASKHVLAEEFALEETLEKVAECFPPARRAMNHTVREHLSLGQ